MAIPVFTVRPADAAQAYRSVDAGTFGIGGGAVGFGEVMQQAIAGVIDTARGAEAQSMQAIAGNADITEVVTAVSKAELALQTTMTIRDRVVQAYQDMMRMPI
jgi:flagellar hook-basal body complex protein FliE